MGNLFVNRQQLAERWQCSVRKIDRLRNLGLLPWVDLTAGHGKRPLVRFRFEDVTSFENSSMMNIKAVKEVAK